MVDFPISASQTGGRLSSGTIAGIVSGVFGGALFISLAIIVYMCNQRRRAISNDASAATIIYEPTEQQTADEKTVTSNPLPTLRTETGEEEMILGGRLRYPDESITDGGRLNSVE